MDIQTQKQEKNQNFDFDESFPSKGSIPHPASPYLSQYLTKVQRLRPMQIGEFKQKAFHEGFELASQFSHKFVRTTALNYGQLLKVQAFYGPFKTFITVHYSDASFSRFDRIKIGEGQYASVYQIKKDGKQFACKVVRINQHYRELEIDSILKEVFMAKLASALGIGPSFSSVYGYDLLINANSAEYAMEVCQTRRTAILEEILLKQRVIPQEEKQGFSNLNFFAEKLREDCLKSLAIMHNFKMVHRDVKLENIGWSLHKQKFVIIDYCFASFISEELGSTTETIYVGTFSYSCQEMRRLFILNTKGFVDLYYNDLFGLEKSVKAGQCASYYNYTESFPATESIQEQIWTQFQLLINFSFAVFTANEQQANQIIASSRLKKQLRMIFNKWQKLQNVEIEKSFAQKLSNPILKEKEEANIILEQKFCERFSTYLYSEKCKQDLLIEHIDLLLLYPHRIKICWRKNKKLMEDIYSFIFEYSGRITERKKIVDDICHHIFPQCSLADFKKVNFLLKEFSLYFKELGNVTRLQTLSQLFSLMDDQEGQRRNDETILRTLKNTSLQLCLQYLLQMGFAKAMVSNSASALEYQKGLLEKIAFLENTQISKNAVILQEVIPLFFQYCQCLINPKFIIVEKDHLKIQSKLLNLQQGLHRKKCQYLQRINFFGRMKIVEEDNNNIFPKVNYLSPQIEFQRRIFIIKRYRKKIQEVQNKIPLLELCKYSRGFQRAQESELMQVIERLFLFHSNPLKTINVLLNSLKRNLSKQSLSKIKQLVEIHKTHLSTLSDISSTREIITLLQTAYFANIRKENEEVEITNQLIDHLKKQIQQQIQLLKQNSGSFEGQGIKIEILLLEVISAFRHKTDWVMFDEKIGKYMKASYEGDSNNLRFLLFSQRQLDIDWFLMDSPQLKSKREDYLLRCCEEILAQGYDLFSVFKQYNFYSIASAALRQNKEDILMRIFTQKVSSNEGTKFELRFLGNVFRYCLPQISLYTLNKTLDQLIVGKKIGFSDLCKQYQYSHIFNQLYWYLHDSPQYDGIRLRFLKIVTFGIETEQIPPWTKLRHIQNIRKQILVLFRSSLSKRKKYTLKKHLVEKTQEWKKQIENITQSRKWRVTQNYQAIVTNLIIKSQKKTLNCQSEQQRQSKIMQRLKELRLLQKQPRQAGQTGCINNFYLDMRQIFYSKEKLQFEDGFEAIQIFVSNYDLIAHILVCFLAAFHAEINKIL